MFNVLVLSHLSFSELWKPLLLGFTILVAVIYFLLVGPMRSRFEGGTPVTTGKKVSFILGLVTFYLAEGSPLNAIGHHFLFSVHMMQQSLLFFVMPPLLLLGTPAWLLRPLLRKPFVKKLFPYLTNPLISVFVFNMTLSFYHIPIIYDTMMKYTILGAAYHVFLTFTSFLVWWLILCPIPEMERLTELQKMGYIVLNGLLLYPACALIIFSDSLFYDHYADVPRLFTFLSPELDQQLGGIIMKLMQEGTLLFALGFTFFRWYRKDQEKDDPETRVFQQTNHLSQNIERLER